VAKILPIKRSLSLKLKLKQYINECGQQGKPIDKNYANSILKKAIENTEDEYYLMEKEFISILETVRHIERQSEINFKSTGQTTIFNTQSTHRIHSLASSRAASILECSNPFIQFLNRLEDDRLIDDKASLTLAIIDICQSKSTTVNQRKLLHTASQYAEALIEDKCLPIIIPSKEILINSNKNNSVCSKVFEIITESIASAVEKIQPSLKFK
jgi:hypothetical protein